MKKILYTLMLVSIFALSVVPALAEEVEEVEEIAPILGCTSETASNYDPQANQDDDSCYVYSSYVIAYQQHFNPANYSVEVSGNSITVKYLTTQFSDATVRVINVETREIQHISNSELATYHTVWIPLKSGVYEITPIVGSEFGLTKTVEVK